MNHLIQYLHSFSKHIYNTSIPCISNRNYKIITITKHESIIQIPNHCPFLAFFHFLTLIQHEPFLTHEQIKPCYTWSKCFHWNSNHNFNTFINTIPHLNSSIHYTSLRIHYQIFHSFQIHSIQTFHLFNFQTLHSNIRFSRLVQFGI